ncbi:MAG: hypothetical protein JSS81_08025 [Acidobacteria bacterium]|nr:hypothetical protein [Acidobacteriota bacterium]
MKKPLLLVITISALGLVGCGGGGSTNANTAKPANSAPANSAPANSASNTATAPKKEDKPKEALKDEKKPEGVKNDKKIKDVPVPESWIQVYDEQKGYGFSVPEGTTGGQQTSNGVDVFIAQTPAPNEISIFVLAYKDPKKSKDDLLMDAVKVLESLGVKVTPGALKGESEDYKVGDATSTSDNGAKEKQRILVATDVTDNYVMILSTPEDKFAANEKTIDEIWGSFEMWSGGASQN